MLQTTKFDVEVPLERVFDVHQRLQMGPTQFSPQCGEDCFVRKHLGRAHAVTQLLLAPTTPVRGCQLPRESRENLVSIAGALASAGETSLSFGDEYRVERPIAIARNIQFQHVVVGRHPLAATAVAMILAVLGLGFAFLVAKMVRQLCAQGSLEDRLLQCGKLLIDRRSVKRAGHQLLDQLQVQVQPVSGLHRRFFFSFARNVGSFADSLCLTHKKPNRLRETVL